MAPQLTEDEIDDLIYFSRAGELSDLTETLKSLADREKVSVAHILITARDEGKSTCLHMATGNGHLGRLSMLVITHLLLIPVTEIVRQVVQYFDVRPKEEKQAFLDEPNEHGNTGLHWAALGGHLDTVKFLLDQGATPALANESNYVPLDLANFNDHKEVAQYFFSFSGGLEAENGEGLDGAVASVEIEDEGEGNADQKVDEKPSSSS